MDKQVRGVLQAAYTLLLATEIVSDVPCVQELLDRMGGCLAVAHDIEAETVQSHYGTLAQQIRYVVPGRIDEIMQSLLSGDW